MIIGVDVSRANREQKTGVEWYAFFLIQELKKITSDDIRVVLYSDKPLKDKLAELPKNWESKVLRWPPRRFWTQIRLSWEMLFNPPDVLFVPVHVFPFIHPKKTVMTVHDIAALKFPRSYGWFQRWYTIWSAKYALKNLWRIIVPSEFVKNSLKDLLVSISERDFADKIKVISHGYNEEYKNNLDEKEIGEVLQKYNIKKPFILSVGRLEEKKNTKRIVQSFNQISYNLKPKTYNLVLVGVPGFGYEEIKKEIEQSPYKDKIIQTGWMNAKDLARVVSGAEVFLYPGLYEGFGLSVLEAMAAGTPVVTSHGSALEEAGGDACVYVNPEDTLEITNALADLLNNENLRKENISKGLERVKNFSWAKCAELTLNHLTT